jgi:tight adherence protein C
VLLLLIATLCLGASLFLLAELVTSPTRERLLSFARAASYGKRMPRRPREEQVSFRDRALLPAMERLARLVLRVNPKASVEEITLRLQSAGLARRLSPTAFLALKGVGAIGGGLVGLLLGSAGGIATAVLLALAGAAVGFIAPDMAVNAKARGRQERIRADLPDALDLLAVTVEAGLGFDAAVAKLTEQMEGPLAEELALTLSEMRIGESRQDALRKLAERTGIAEVGAFARAIIQADQFGISLGRILRLQAIDTRNRRQMAAEERAMKAPVKMLFPTVVFIFPAMFIVILGPAFLNLTKILQL